MLWVLCRGPNWHSIVQTSVTQVPWLNILIKQDLYNNKIVSNLVKSLFDEKLTFFWSAIKLGFISQLYILHGSVLIFILKSFPIFWIPLFGGLLLCCLIFSFRNQDSLVSSWMVPVLIRFTVRRGNVHVSSNMILFSVYSKY